MNPNYPKIVNGKPVYCKMPQKITHKIIAQAYRDRLLCASTLLHGYFVAACISDQGMLLPNNAKVYKDFAKCCEDCDKANSFHGFTKDEFDEAYDRMLVAIRNRKSVIIKI